MTGDAAGTPSIFVSYAWGDDVTPEGREREALVNRLCSEAEARGVHIQRDRTSLRVGDSIDKFMQKIGNGGTIFVFLSDKYLRSPFCMYELNEIWRTSRQEDEKFLSRVRFYTLADAKYRRPEDWVEWARFWKGEYDRLVTLVRDHMDLGIDPIYQRMVRTRSFYLQVTQILALFADAVTAEDFEAFLRHGFGEFQPPLERKGASLTRKDESSPHPPLVTMPPGRFYMGSPTNEERWPAYDGREEPRRLVSLVQPFGIGARPVTLGQYSEFMADRGYDMGHSAFVWTGEKWEIKEGRGWLDPGFAQADDHPVTCVSWHDAQAYIAWLNARTGLAGREDAFRLPSEAEWEYACRAGTTTPFHFGETLSTDLANYDGNHKYGRGQVSKVFRQGTTPAGQFPPNAFGLYDMHGNVWEWCQDNWHNNYQGAPSDGRVWEGGDASRRVLRGGSWFNYPQSCRSACRNRNSPSNRYNYIGFRLARTLSPPPS